MFRIRAALLNFAIVLGLAQTGFAQSEIKPVPAVVTTVDVIGKLDSDNIFWPDPSQRVVVPDETLAANPGRPGVPLSIPGLPAESASGGIKAPQYFAPGVAGDHGEPIAQYFQVGSYLIPNNLSANAHGNGYSDPNIIVPATIESVRVDAGAFNAREGNHAVDLATTYQLGNRIDPFLTVMGDPHDIDLMAGWSPADPMKRLLMAVEVASGNGLLELPEQRRQYKFTTIRQVALGSHNITMALLGYWGESRIPGLVPIDVRDLHDTIDPRQRDQTHSAVLAFNDNWTLNSKDALQFGAFFRTYNLSLSSNFGDGLIRQSEFRTVTGSNAAYLSDISKYFKLFAGFDFARDAPRRVELDRHENAADLSYYGPFKPVTSNNLTFSSLAPYLVLSGSVLKYVTYSLGWRRDFIDVDNEDLLSPVNSFQRRMAVDSPKASIMIAAPSRFLPTVAFSFGQSFYTSDPRIGVGSMPGNLVNRSHAYQLVISKLFDRTEVRLTLARVTSEQSLAKIDADTGLQQDEGPSRNFAGTVAVRHYFSFGLLQGSFSKADARDLLTGLPVPEAPRLIFDAFGTIDRLPYKLHFRAEVEYIGRKPLGDEFLSVPVREVRGALVRSLRGGLIEAGANFQISSGYSGQTSETLAVANEATEQIVGVRVPSYVGASLSYRFRRRN